MKSEEEKYIEEIGFPNTWKIIHQVKIGECMESTEALDIPDAGCLVRVQTLLGDNISEAITFVPYVETKNYDGFSRLRAIK